MDDEDEPEAIVTYLEIINEFIKTNIQEEMTEYLSSKGVLRNENECVDNISPETLENSSSPNVNNE
jgi:hypothetical protein